MKAVKECTCNVQPLQELAHEASLNFSLDETISAMMMHIGDAIQSMGKTVLQDKAAVLHGTLLLASDATAPSDGAPTVAEALEELAAFDRHHTGFRLAEEHEELFQKAYENLKTRVAAEFESYIHCALPLPLRTFVSISCWVQEPLTQNVQITQKAHVLKEPLHRWKSCGGGTNETSGTSEMSAGGRHRQRVAPTSSPTLQFTHQNTDNSTVFGNTTTPLDSHAVAHTSNVCSAQQAGARSCRSPCAPACNIS